MATKALLTSEDFALFAPRSDKKLELIRGEVYEASPVTQRHSEVTGGIGGLLGDWNKENRAGRVGIEGGYTIELRPDTVRAPDISFVAKGRIPREQARRGFP